jgi:hypothetical protein
MVKRLVFALLILICLFSLTTCDLLVAIFSLSPFPGYLAQAVASVDMRDDVEKFLGGGYDRWWSDVFVLRKADGTEGVFLIVHKDGGGQRVYAFDVSLELQNSVTLPNRQSDVHVVEADGRFFVGNVHFDPVDMGNPVVDSTDLWGYGFSTSSWNFLVHGGGTQVTFEQRNPVDWTPGSSKSPYIEYTGFDYISYELRGLGYDPDPLTLDVYLFFFSWEDDILRIIKTPKSHYLATLPDAPNDLIPGGGYEYSPTISDVRGDYLDYTRKGFVATSKNRGYFHLFDFNGDVLKRFYVGIEGHDEGLDFDVAGEYYYVFDDQNFHLYKAATGF